MKNLLKNLLAISIFMIFTISPAVLDSKTSYSVISNYSMLNDFTFDTGPGVNVDCTDVSQFGSGNLQKRVCLDGSKVHCEIEDVNAADIVGSGTCTFSVQ